MELILGGATLATLALGGLAFALAGRRAHAATLLAWPAILAAGVLSLAAAARVIAPESLGRLGFALEGVVASALGAGQSGAMGPAVSLWALMNAAAILCALLLSGAARLVARAGAGGLWEKANTDWLPFAAAIAGANLLFALAGGQIAALIGW